jgi:hypothetical protein
MSEISPYEDLLKFCKEVKEGDIIFGSANMDTAKNSYKIEQNEKKFYIRMIGLALQRVAVNGGGPWPIRDDVHVWISHTHKVSPMVNGEGKYTHIVFPNGLFEELIYVSYQAAANAQFFPSLPGDGSVISVSDNNPITWSRTAAWWVLCNPEEYKIVSLERAHLANILIDLMFLFCIDHECCHCLYQHRNFGDSGLKSVEIAHVREFDADMYACNRAWDMLIGSDKFLSVYGMHGPILSELNQNSNTAHCLLSLLALSAEYATMRIVAKDTWEYTKSFEVSVSSTDGGPADFSTHPLEASRFALMGCTWVDICLRTKNLDKDAIKELILFVDRYFPKWFEDNGSKIPPFVAINSAEAKRWHEKLYAYWILLIKCKAVGNWIPLKQREALIKEIC